MILFLLSSSASLDPFGESPFAGFNWDSLLGDVLSTEVNSLRLDGDDCSW